MATSTTAGAPIFISYAHKDNESSDPAKRWLDRLREQLEPLAQQGQIAVCSDQDIELGDDWHASIQDQLSGARAAVLLVSPAFLASQYIRNSELPVLLRNAQKQGVKIIPILLRPCLFAESRFRYPDPTTGPEEFSLASLQAAGSPARALSEMSEAEQDRALLKVAQFLAKLTESAGAAPAQPRSNRKPRATGRKDRETAADCYNHGLRCLSDKNYEDALDAFDQAIRLDPAMAYAYYNRGLTYLSMRDTESAIEDFDRALDLGFGDALLFLHRGNAFSREGDVARALADYAQAIALQPSNPLPYLNRGEVYENTLQRNLAVADYNAILQLECDPDIQEKARKRLRAMGAGAPAGG